MMILRNLTLLVCVLVLFGCSAIPGLDDVLPDNRTTYKKSRNLPTLEVPPDLTVTKGEYEAAIPGEGESTSLSEFERQRSQAAGGGAVIGGGAFSGERWLALRGKSIDIWPSLREFLQGKGYIMDLDDAELGVMETDWKEEGESRYKLKIFTEPGQSGGTVLFLSSDKQGLSEGEWLDIGPDVDLETEVISELNVHFHGTAVGSTGSTGGDTSGSSSASSALPEAIQLKAEVLDVGDGKSYLAVPQEFTRAWRDTEVLIQRAGYFIEGSDRKKALIIFVTSDQKGWKKMKDYYPS